MKQKKYDMSAGLEDALDGGGLDLYIGKRIKLRRMMLKMSQDERASMIGGTFQQVQKYENGSNRVSASRIFVLSKVLQVGVGFFFEGIEKEVPAVVSYISQPDGVPAGGRVCEEAAAFDPMSDTETLRLVNAYWRLNDVEKRNKILDFIVSMTGAD